MKRKHNKGQSALEYATLFAVVVGALLTTQLYMKRGIQGRLKESVDDLGEQYDPRASISDVTHTLSSTTSTNIIAITESGGYWTQRTDSTSSDEVKSGTTTVGAY